MKTAIMQPYFFPYLGYYALIKSVDLFILFDTPQYIRHGWIDRNRILKPNGEPLYIKVPLKKHGSRTSIDRLIINNDEKWKDKLLAQLVPYKRKAPNYWKVLSLIKEILDIETESIVKLNHFTLSKTCEYLGIDTPINIWSEMNISIKEVNAPDEWALNICKAINADIYYNPIGGTSFFDRAKYKDANIDLKFLEIEALPYNQNLKEFVPFLSIIDVLMFCDIDKASLLLNNYKLIS